MIVQVRNERLAPLANAYENRLFGRDFYTRLEDIETWLASPMFFWSVCSEMPVPGRHADISGSLAILIVSVRQAEVLIAGEIKETELRPWAPGGGDRPAMYFCSYSGSIGGAGRLQFEAALDYFARAADLEDDPPAFAFSIAASKDGARHLARSGFVATGTAYRGKYAIFRADCDGDQKLSRIWSTLLHCQSRSLTVHNAGVEFRSTLLLV